MVKPLPCTVFLAKVCLEGHLRDRHHGWQLPPYANVKFTQKAHRHIIWRHLSQKKDKKLTSFNQSYMRTIAETLSSPHKIVPSRNSSGPRVMFYKTFDSAIGYAGTCEGKCSSPIFECKVVVAVDKEKQSAVLVTAYPVRDGKAMDIPVIFSKPREQHICTGMCDIYLDQLCGRGGRFCLSWGICQHFK